MSPAGEHRCSQSTQQSENTGKRTRNQICRKSAVLQPITEGGVFPIEEQKRRCKGCERIDGKLKERRGNL